MRGEKLQLLLAVHFAGLLVRDVSGAFKELNATLCGPRDLQASSFRMSLAESEYLATLFALPVLDCSLLYASTRMSPRPT